MKQRKLDEEGKKKEEKQEPVELVRETTCTLEGYEMPLHLTTAASFPATVLGPGPERLLSIIIINTLIQYLLARSKVTAFKTKMKIIC